MAVRTSSGESDIGSPLPERPVRDDRPMMQLRQTSTDEIGQMAADLHDDQHMLLATLATAKDRLKDAGSLLALPVTSPVLMRRGMSNMVASAPPPRSAKRAKLESPIDTEFDFNFDEMGALSSPSLASLGELDDDPPELD